VLALGNRDAASKSDVGQLKREIATLQQQASTTSQAAQTKVDKAIAQLKASNTGSVKKQQQATQAEIDKIKAFLHPYGGP
jgi:hypothetical protein